MRRHAILLSIVVTLAMAVGTAAAQDRTAGPRIITAYDSFETVSGLAGFIAMPDAVIGLNVSAFTMQTGEPASSCASGPELRSAWFGVVLPGGTLTIDTSHNGATNYDTVVALFAYSHGPVAALEEVACADNTSGDKAVLNAPLAADAYIVRITCVGVCASASLSVAASYTSSQSAPNDSIEGAEPLTLNKAVTSTQVAFATAGTENADLGCPMFNSVWYTFTTPVNGNYSITTAGSSLNRPLDDSIDTKLALYVSTSGNPIPDDLVQIRCENDNFGTPYAAVENVFLTGGGVLFVRVGTTSAVNVMPSSVMRVKATTPMLYGMLENSGFEVPLESSGWVLKNPSTGDGVSTEYPLTGTYSVELNGVPGKKTKLKQTFDLAEHGVQFPKDSLLQLYYSFGTNGTTADDVKVSLQVNYPDGTKTKVSRKVPSYVTPGFMTTISLSAIVTRSKATAVTVSFKAKNTTGTMYLDSITLIYYSDPTRSAKVEPSGVLPVPAPPG